jgi:hypothetical protein
VGYKKSKLPDLAPVFRAVVPAAREALVDAMDVYAQEVVNGFRTRIAEQDFPSFREIRYPDSPEENKNLSPLWVRRKRAKDADERTMIATRTYVDSIRVWRRLHRNRRGGLWRVGFHPLKRARDLNGHIVDITLDTLARIHEHGTPLNARRPHWHPHLLLLRQQAPKARKMIAAKVAKAIVKASHGRLVMTP